MDLFALQRKVESYAQAYGENAQQTIDAVIELLRALVDTAALYFDRGLFWFSPL